MQVSSSDSVDSAGTGDDQTQDPSGMELYPSGMNVITYNANSAVGSDNTAIDLANVNVNVGGNNNAPITGTGQLSTTQSDGQSSGTENPTVYTTTVNTVSTTAAGNTNVDQSSQNIKIGGNNNVPVSGTGGTSAGDSGSTVCSIEGENSDGAYTYNIFTNQATTDNANIQQANVDVTLEGDNNEPITGMTTSSG
ncbi:uncharacterized protein [Rhodnius prolixus]|uniref:uncharacterized protein n=1 Tax=Rhodnius prolixus TaxID=13249 RepID=UPI003D1890FC